MCIAGAMLPWFLHHPDLVLAVAWIGGGLALRPWRVRALLAPAGLAVAAGALAVSASLGGGRGLLLSAGLVDLEGPTVAGSYALLAALVVVQARASSQRVGLASALPLVVGGWWGGGALVAGVVELATAGLEPGRPGRCARLLAHLSLALAAAVDHERLGVSLVLRRLGLGLDGAVAAAVALALGLGLLGWGLLWRSLRGAAGMRRSARAP